MTWEHIRPAPGQRNAFPVCLCGHVFAPQDAPHRDGDVLLCDCGVMWTLHVHDGAYVLMMHEPGAA